MGKNIKKHYIPPYVELLSVEEDDLVLTSGTGTGQKSDTTPDSETWEPAKKSGSLDWEGGSDEGISDADRIDAEEWGF